MNIDIWSDVICPFCYIGKRHLETALSQFQAQFPGAEDITVTHRAFRLMPGEPVAPVEEMFAKKYGQSPAQAEASMRNVEAMAAQAGLEFHIPGTQTGDTLQAQKLLKLAANKGVQPALLERLYRAYFTETRSVFDTDSLLKLGHEVGLDRDDMKAALASDDVAAQIVADQAQAQKLGVRGVPYVVIDGAYAISGAQPPQAFLQALNAAQATKTAKATQVTLDGGVCGVDGCEP